MLAQLISTGLTILTFATAPLISSEASLRKYEVDNNTNNKVTVSYDGVEISNTLTHHMKSSVRQRIEELEEKKDENLPRARKKSEYQEPGNKNSYEYVYHHGTNRSHMRSGGYCHSYR